MSIINVAGLFWVNDRGPMVSGLAGEDLAGLTESEVHEQYPLVKGIERFRSFANEIRLGEPIGLLLATRPECDPPVHNVPPCEHRDFHTWDKETQKCLNCGYFPWEFDWYEKD